MPVHFWLHALCSERLPNHPPLLVKIAPDLTEEDLRDVAAVALEAKVDGIIISNTTSAWANGKTACLAGEEVPDISRPISHLLCTPASHPTSVAGVTAPTDRAGRRP